MSTDPQPLHRPERMVQRELVASFPTFLSRCTRGHAALDAVSQRHRLAPHTLGLLNSAYLARGARAVTEANLRDSLPYATRSRLGGEHWTPLIEGGFAGTATTTWIITERGMALLAELYSEIRKEISERAVSPTIAASLSEVFELVAQRVPITRRALAIRRLWSQTGPETSLHRLYRAIWELWIYRDVCFRTQWERAGYTGPLVDALTQVWRGATTFEDLVERLATKQTRETVLACVRSLSERGDLAQDADRLLLAGQARAKRDEIEQRTDAVYFERWPIGPRLEQLAEDLNALMTELAAEP